MLKIISVIFVSNLRYIIKINVRSLRFIEEAKRFATEAERRETPKEYADKWNQNMFLNDFDKRDENAGVNVKLSEVYLEEHLPHYIWGSGKFETNK